MLEDFYRKMGKYLRLKSSKKVLHKSQDPKSRRTEEKEEDKKQKSKGRKDKSLKKSRLENNKADNRYVTHYMNYTPLNAPIDHVFAVTRDKSIFGELDVIRHDRYKIDDRKFFRFHKDIGHDTSRCNLLKM